MAKNKAGANGFVHVLLPMFLLLQIAPLAAGVDIIFYNSIGGNCGGAGYACNNINKNQCCGQSSGTYGSVKITTSGSASCLGAHVYRNGGCTTTVYTSTHGNVCLYGGTGQYSGATWFSSCRRRRSLLAEVDCNEAAAVTASCTKRVEPTAVVYTEDAQKGDWILEGSNVTELYSQLMNVHDGGKVNWLKSQGATYRELDSDLTFETDLND